MEKNYQKVREYILKSWHEAVIKRENDPDFILPFDFIPPTNHGHFSILYYWDTYFTNKGLYADKLPNYAYGNVKDLLFALEKFGCVPNSCWEKGADCASQPPLLYMMVDDYYKYAEDIAFLKEAYESLKKEYSFWMTKRILKNGLNAYGTNYKEWNGENAKYFANRVGWDISDWTEEQKIEFCINRNAEGESGEDCTPRFLNKGSKINPVDLNSYLYGFEVKMCEFAEALDLSEGDSWLIKANRRRQLMEKYMLDKESGVYFDYDSEDQKPTGIYCVANYIPYIVGISSDKKALELINSKLILENGVTSCQRKDDVKGSFQWGYPNALAPHQYWAYVANKKADNGAIASLIAKKYLDNVTGEFVLSGKLFEKYDAKNGGIAKVNEYGCPEMLGWTAGVFAFFHDELK